MYYRLSLSLLTVSLHQAMWLSDNPSPYVAQMSVAIPN